jgi:hypothetical protein
MASSEIETKSQEKLTDRLGNLNISWMTHLAADYIPLSKKNQVYTTANQETSEKVANVTLK